jgi:hypothetical protein
VKHIIQILTLNSAALWLYLANANTLLTFISLILAITYTIYRWVPHWQPGGRGTDRQPGAGSELKSKNSRESKKH